MGSIIGSEELDDMAISTRKDWLQHEFAPVLEENRALWHFTPAHVKATLRPRLKFATQEFITVTAYGRCRKITLLYLPYTTEKEDLDRYRDFFKQFIPKEGKLTRTNLEPLLNAYRTVIRMELMK